jgi:hypothetical protein
MTEPKRIARCYGAQYSQDRLMNGQIYAVEGGEIYFGIRYLRVYEIPRETWEDERIDVFEQGEDRVWRLNPVVMEGAYLGEFSASRFEVLYRKGEIPAEIKRMRDMYKFTGGPVPGDTTKGPASKT